ncbi:MULTISPECIES: hypothetical protein [unclassified Picosynechococcus]|uniref:hypothetical protein n=1 Tax=unclassified Picosynechococcus TaxID=3079910 RepID=UPI0007457CD1|nr:MULTISPECIES: hypothetical protein [unclassified Picosynechococcus]AMA10253.1 glycogen debranching protein [Picosynechococcus sp. PCC 73109]ANV91608.1 glycogen debranching protein [Picosynechococcus sp. PCC 8807]
MTIWVNEQIDPTGILQACIACQNEKAAKDCHEQWKQKLATDQTTIGWEAKIRTVDSWDDVPVNALKLSF